MNEFLACGRDDTDAQDGLVEWDPVRLTRSQYARVVRDLWQHTWTIERHIAHASLDARTFIALR